MLWKYIKLNKPIKYKIEKPYLIKALNFFKILEFHKNKNFLYFLRILTFYNLNIIKNSYNKLQLYKNNFKIKRKIKKLKTRH